MIDIVEILIHWYAGRSQNELAASLGVDRKTLRKYTAPARAAGIEPGGPPMAEADWRTLATGWFPELVDYRAAAGVLAADRAAPRLHRRPAQGGGDGRRRSTSVCADEHGLDASVASRAPVGAGEPARGRPPGARSRCCATPRRPVCEAQIDYGRLGMWLDPRSGRRRTVWAFVMVLCLLAAHVRAPDPDHGPGRVDRRARRGVRVLRRRARPAGPGQPQDRGRPARPLRPEDQPGVCGAGRALRHAGRPGPRAQTQGQAAGRTADALRPGLVLAGPGVHLARARCAPTRWPGAARWPATGRVARWTGRPRPRCSPRSRRRALAPLPAAPFVLATWSSARIGPDIHAKVGATLYSLPWRYLGERVDARSTTDHGAVLPPRRADQDPSGQGTRQADRLRRLPAGEDRLPPAHPDLVSAPGHRGRPGLRRR